jgi:transaldolase/glucose-6-phosphate isomerase
MNPLQRLFEAGQSIWLDSISRNLIESGDLARLIREDGIGGVTSNPSIFEKAIAEGAEYRSAIELILADDPGASAYEMYERLAVRDIRDAADALRGVFERTRGRDGYVSLEVTLQDGDDRGAIVREAQHLREAVARPNLLVKVPGTAEGIAAFETLTGEGVNVNVTLLFSVATYVRVAQAYLAGLEAFAKHGGDLSKAASVASFFVSRIDSVVDEKLAERIARASSASDRFLLRTLQGRTAIANAKVAYARYGELFSGARWEALAARGARSQRVLWASTSTKNPSYPDILYVEELVGPDTVNTAPMPTIDAYRDHGRPSATLTRDLDAARDALAALGELGIDLESVTDDLLAMGMASFGAAFHKLLDSLASRRQAATRP